MKPNILAGLVALSVVVGGLYSAVAQRPDARSGQSDRGNSRGNSSSSQGTLNYNDPSKRNTQSSERDERKQKAAEDAKRKAEEDKRRAEREKRYGQNSQNGKATGMTSTNPADAKKDPKAAGKPGSERAKKPANAGGTDPTAREVTEVMLEAVQTQKVQFDPVEAKADPSVLLLNAPKFDKAERTRAGDTGMGSPL